MIATTTITTAALTTNGSQPQAGSNMIGLRELGLETGLLCREGVLLLRECNARRLVQGRARELGVDGSDTLLALRDTALELTDALVVLGLAARELGAIKKTIERKRPRDFLNVMRISRHSIFLLVRDFRDVRGVCDACDGFALRGVGAF